MSGIMGIYYLDRRPIERQDLARMVDILEHRGADGADIWINESVGFGHRMLWTTPESLLEKLPSVNQTGDLVITCDARIDNRDELICALQFDNCPPEKIADSQIILAAYDKWGEQCPEHLLGDFAFAIWNGRKQSLFCARDHMGVKPLYYYYQAAKIFAFASEIKALLCLQEIPRLLNKVKVGDYLAAILDDKSNTFYQDIFRLPPGCCMVLSAKGMQIRSYWSLDPSRELELGSDEEYAEALREIFAEAVRCRLRSAFPIGSHLSGGLDSSSVTCMARQVLMEGGISRPLHTFSNIFDIITECDERPFIEAVLAQGSMIPHYVHADQQGPLSNLEQIFRYHDEAIPAPTHFLLWGLNHAARTEGVRVVLDGLDGDNTISHGDGYLTELVRKGQWAEFAKEVGDLYKLGLSPSHYLRQHGLTYLEELARGWKWVDFVRETNHLLKHFNVSRQQLFLQHGLKPLLPQSVLSAWQVLRGRKQSLNGRHLIIKRSFAKQIALNKRIQALTGFQSSQPLTEREQHWRGLTSGVLTLGLEVSDHYAAAFSLEPRHPFMDKRLIEFCLSLPPEQKLNQGWSRFVMRRAMTNVLPEQVQWRRGKSDMSSSFVHGLLVHNRKLVDEVMQNDLHGIAEYINTKYLRKIYKELISVSEIKPPESLIDVSLWQVAMFTLWLQHSQLKQ
ncbi:lasso peptide isopeptide bond-forming cyclase [Mastigocladopsis repens]|uniref:lasso peptide isopeptide bond-forming cyclase n=1 Tax=Mastigocladopsis repens TaxID=221287 RepID=UPI00030EFCB2|nr:lasso peptide isopeptide bond-forming cyclase [Mastigocladopsis repens]